MSKNFRETLNARLETDSEFRKEYEALAPEYELAIDIDRPELGTPYALTE